MPVPITSPPAERIKHLSPGPSSVTEEQLLRALAYVSARTWGINKCTARADGKTLDR